MGAKKTKVETRWCDKKEGQNKKKVKKRKKKQVPGSSS